MSESRTTTIVVIFLAGGFGAALLTNKEAQIDQPVATVSGDADDVLLNGSVVFQRERNDCGAAVLAMILNRFGRHVTLRELAQKIALSSNGASLQQLKEAAREFGLQAEGWRLSLEDMMRVRYPAILFMSRGHFVVADSVDPSGAFLRDMRSAQSEAALFAACDRHLLAEPARRFSPEPYPGVIARPNCETSAAHAPICSL